MEDDVARHHAFGWGSNEISIYVLSFEVKHITSKDRNAEKTLQRMQQICSNAPPPLLDETINSTKLHNTKFAPVLQLVGSLVYLNINKFVLENDLC